MHFNCPEFIFLFLIGMTGALAPFSYLVFYIRLRKKNVLIRNYIGTRSNLGQNFGP